MLMSTANPTATTITADELAAMLRITRRTLTNMRRRGQIPAPVLDGRSPRWACEQIEAWLRAGRD